VGTLTLVRHGQASYGAADYDRLSERGIEQARALGRRWAANRFAPDAIYAGPMRRQIDTATLAVEAARDAGHTLPAPTVLDELAEYPAFELLGRFMPQFVQEHPELRSLLDGTATAADRHALMDRGFWLVIDAWTRDQLDCGDIETFGAFVERVGRAMTRMIAGHAGGGARVVGVTSGGPIGIALKRTLGPDAMATVNHWRLVRNASVTELLWRSARPEQLSLLGFNHIDHLPAELHTFR
jgi:broad specificity phosphatase PhoE